MLQQAEPDDYVLATGETHSVREFVDLAFCRGRHAITGRGPASRKRASTRDGRVLVEVDPRFFRPAEVDLLFGDATKAREKLGWEPKEKFADLVKEMVRHDVQLLRAAELHALLIRGAQFSSCFAFREPAL